MELYFIIKKLKILDFGAGSGTNIITLSNYGDVYVNMNNGYSGLLSSLRYYSYSLTGVDIENLKSMISKMSNLEVFLDIKEVRKPEIEAKLVAENIANQLEKRISFRRAMKKAVQSSMRLGAKGIKIVCSGRLGGAEIARTEKYHEGSVPLHTLRSDIDYATARAETTYGICGIKVWINKGEILIKDPYASEKKETEQGSVR